MVKLLHTTLLGRGYMESTIHPIFFEAATKLELKTSTSLEKKNLYPKVMVPKYFSIFSITNVTYVARQYETHMKGYANP